MRPTHLLAQGLVLAQLGGFQVLFRHVPGHLFLCTELGEALLQVGNFRLEPHRCILQPRFQGLQSRLQEPLQATGLGQGSLPRLFLVADGHLQAAQHTCSALLTVSPVAGFLLQLSGKLLQSILLLLILLLGLLLHLHHHSLQVSLQPSHSFIDVSFQLCHPGANILPQRLHGVPQLLQPRGSEALLRLQLGIAVSQGTLHGADEGAELRLQLLDLIGPLANGCFRLRLQLLAR
mmetsp:Transcript_24050/g.52342  ORF Transcript_24050/g.52342 Transcript_24050/m.52342 type:complete len:234 (-) Transcript_24050:725-1426(-)